jgi:hypothetical protein
MRLAPSDIVAAPALTSPTEETGIPRVVLERSGVRQLDDLNADWVVVLQTGVGGGIDLRSLAKSSL